MTNNLDKYGLLRPETPQTVEEIKDSRDRRRRLRNIGVSTDATQNYLRQLEQLKAEISELREMRSALKLQVEAEKDGVRHLKKRQSELRGKIVNGLVQRECSTVEDIVADAVKKFGISEADIISPRRVREVTKVKRYVYYRCHLEVWDKSLTTIGKKLGGRDHSTITYGAIKHAKENNLPLPGRFNRK